MEQSKETDIEKELQQAIRDKKSVEKLNKQLLEIMKNRANAKRKITPKKKHDGYVVTRSEQFDYIYCSNKYKREPLCLWRTMIQTPIEIGVKLDVVESIIVDNVTKKLLMTKLEKLSGCLNENIKSIKSKEWDNGLYLLDAKFRQNTKLRLWEISIIHNQAITIPEEMCV